MDFCESDTCAKHTASESCLLNLIDTPPLPPRARSMNSMYGPSTDDPTDLKSMLFVIQVQKAIIETYKAQLDVAKNDLMNCKQNFQHIRETNTFDPNVVANVLIHHGKNAEDKTIFQNAIRFMQNKLNYVLNEFDGDDAP